MADAGFNLILPHMKGGDGRIYWPSKRFPEAIAPGYETFDFPRHFIDACRARGIQMHAWFMDFFDGETGPAYAAHPEWAMKNAEGKTTADEILRGRRFGHVWFCPAQQPGYADQWLAPMMREFAEMYDADGIHHDYLRYPGDMAPDQYCFCDFCLEHLPKFAGYLSETYPDEPFFHELYDRGYLEAHWEQSPRVLPANWPGLSRAFKSRFLLEGGFFAGGRSDLDYFFYLYRAEMIERFAALSAKEIRAARPEMEISAALFKNPIHSGRFIGQDWRRYGPHIDTCIPMDYRDHFPGSFDVYLDLLEETIPSQKTWASTYSHYYVGIAINFLYNEERLAGQSYPPEKLQRVLECIEITGVEGVVMFCEGHLHEYGLWETARDCLAT